MVATAAAATASLTDLNFISTYKRDQKSKSQKPPNCKGAGLLAATRVVAFLNVRQSWQKFLQG
jgi:hypothetical protein